MRVKFKVLKRHEKKAGELRKRPRFYQPECMCPSSQCIREKLADDVVFAMGSNSMIIRKQQGIDLIQFISLPRGLAAFINWWDSRGSDSQRPKGEFTLEIPKRFLKEE